jgi:hypothetical protein
MSTPSALKIGKEMLKFEKLDNQLLANYSPDGNINWIISKLASGEVAVVKKTFFINKSDLYEIADEELEKLYGSDSISFVIGNLEDEYYHIKKGLLGIDFDLYLYCKMKIEQKTFLAGQGSSIFRHMGKIKPLDPVYIGGSKEGCIPVNAFTEIINVLPSSYEIFKYSEARISSILRRYIETDVDGLSSYDKYIATKKIKSTEQSLNLYDDFELIKFRELAMLLLNMLENEIEYSESEWQDNIMKIIRCIYPKYIKAIKEAPVKDYIENKERYIDLLLIDAEGSVDIIEIKKPFDQCIVTTGTYRDNHIPLRDLSGAIMQAEKYIYHLSKWGVEGEKCYNDKYRGELPNELKIKITNPKAIIIMGRSNNLNEKQKIDFEIIKRKYSNILDIITYDDLNKRLDTIIKALDIKT